MFKKSLIILTSILFLVVVPSLFIKRPQSPDEVTFAPLFQILGKFIQTADSSLSRLLAVGEWDEAAFGNALKEKLDDEYEICEESEYLNDLVETLSKNSRKDFEYKVYVDPDMTANAYAMAGGVIVFSVELLELLENEAQVASILAHEIAHIELDHCVNAVKFELASKEYNLDTRQFFSTLYDLLIEISFSKTQEDEADDYAFNLIARETLYWPAALSESFQHFLTAFGEAEDSMILEEFFQSHPDMEYRRDKYSDRAQKFSGSGKKYLGYSNLELLTTIENEEFDQEWKDF